MANGRRGGGPFWKYIGLVAFALLTAGISIAAASGFTLRPAAPYAGVPLPTQAQSTTSPLRAPVAVFIGDSYTAGAGGDGVRWTSLVAKEFGWKEVNLGRGGTGYVTTSSKNGCGLDYCPNYAEMVPDAVRARPDIVVVAGGRNDGGVHMEGIEVVFATIRNALPSATIYAVDPMWDDDPAPAWLAKQAKSVKSAVTAVGGGYVDAGQPLTGKRDLIANDGVHPNAEGYRAIAAAVVAAMPETARR